MRLEKIKEFYESGKIAFFDLNQKEMGKDYINKLKEDDKFQATEVFSGMGGFDKGIYSLKQIPNIIEKKGRDITYKLVKIESK